MAPFILYRWSCDSLTTTWMCVVDVDVDVDVDVVDVDVVVVIYSDPFLFLGGFLLFFSLLILFLLFFPFFL